MKKIEVSAPTELARLLRLELETAGIIVPLSITPTSEIPDSHRAHTDNRCAYCKCDLIVPDSLVDHVVEVVAHLLRDRRFAGLFSRLVILDIDADFPVGPAPLAELSNSPLTKRRSGRVSSKKKEF